MAYRLQVRYPGRWATVKTSPVFASDYQAFAWLARHPQEYVGLNGWRVRSLTADENTALAEGKLGRYESPAYPLFGEPQ